MPARLDKPLRLLDAAKTAEASQGRARRAIAPETEQRNRRVHTLDRQASGVADSGSGGHIGRECGGAQGFRHLVQFMARASMGVVQYRLPALLGMDIAR